MTISSDMNIMKKWNVMLFVVEYLIYDILTHVCR